MEVSLVKINAGSRHILENLFPYYIYDMSEYMGWSPNDNGHFSFNKSSLDVYWERVDHAPYFIYVDNELPSLKSSQYLVILFDTIFKNRAG